MQSIVEKVLDQFRPGLQADGYDLKIESIENDAVYVKLTISPEACSDCLLPKETLQSILAAGIEKETNSKVKITILDPREP